MKQPALLSVAMFAGGGFLLITLNQFVVIPGLMRWGLSSLDSSLLVSVSCVLIASLVLWYWLTHAAKAPGADQIEYRQLFDQSPNPMWVYELETQRFLMVNATAELLYGFEQEEWLSMTLYDIRPRAEHERLTSDLQQQQSTFSDSGIWQHRNKRGAVFLVQIYSQPITFDGKEARLVVAINVQAQEQSRREVERLNLRLQEREQFLQSILDHLDEVVWVRRMPDRQLTFISPASTQRLGLTPELLRADDADSLLERIMAVDRPAVEAHLVIAADRGYHELEYRYHHPDGSLRRLLDKASVIYDEQGQAVAMQGVTTDLTSLRRAQQGQLAQAQRTLEILNGIDDPFLVVGPNERLTHANQALLELVGREDQNPRNLTLEEVLPAAEAPQLAQAYQLALETRRSQRVEYFAPQHQRWWRAAIYPITEALAIYCQDITAERALQAEIERSQRNLLAMINNTHDVMVLLDADLRLVLANDAYHQLIQTMFGGETSIEKGDSVIPPSLPNDMKVHWQGLFARALQGEAFQIIIPGEKLSQDLLEVEFSFNPIWHQGQVVGVGCVQRDTSERKQREEKILQQNEQLREIAFVQSHEVRRHLANLMGLILLFDRKDMGSQPNADVLQHMDEVSQQLDAVIHRIVNKVYQASGGHEEAIKKGS